MFTQQGGTLSVGLPLCTGVRVISLKRRGCSIDLSSSDYFLRPFKETVKKTKMLECSYKENKQVEVSVKPLFVKEHGWQCHICHLIQALG